MSQNSISLQKNNPNSISPKDISHKGNYQTPSQIIHRDNSQIPSDNLIIHKRWDKDCLLIHNAQILILDKHNKRNLQVYLDKLFNKAP